MIPDRRTAPPARYNLPPAGMVAFLRARLDDAAEAATAAELNSPSPWRTSRGGSLVHNALGEGSDIVADCWSHTAGEHTAHHDPATVLADLAMKRRLVDAWEEVQGLIDAQADRARRELAVLMRHGLDLFAHDLAGLYRAHPDYQPEWTP